MRRAIVIIVLAVLARSSSFSLSAATTQPSTQPSTRPVRFDYIDIYLDPNGQPLAAWQVELKATGDVRFVGIEGGDDKGFQNPPYYDPAALTHEGPARIILGAFSLSDNLPAAKTRVARIMVRVAGERPTYTIHVTAAGSKDATPIPAEATFVEGAAR